MSTDEVWRCLYDALERGERAMLLIVTAADGSTAGAPGFKMAVAAGLFGVSVPSDVQAQAEAMPGFFD